jgi:hypothetical protein
VQLLNSEGSQGRTDHLLQITCARFYAFQPRRVTGTALREHPLFSLINSRWIPLRKVLINHLVGLKPNSSSDYGPWILLICFPINIPKQSRNSATTAQHPLHLAAVRHPFGSPLRIPPSIAILSVQDGDTFHPIDGMWISSKSKTDPMGVSSGPDSPFPRSICC